jgi:UPF0755 protein
MRRWVLAGSLLAGLGALAGYGVVAVFDAPGPLPSRLDVVVPRGPGDLVAQSLRRAGVLRSVWQFRAFAVATSWQGPLRSAEFAFPARASIAQVLYVMRHGRPVQHLLTIPEGLTAWRIGLILGRAGGLPGDIALPAEGAVLPESYSYEFGTAPGVLVARAERAMRAALEAVWAERAPGLGLSSPRELLVLASVVERETRLASERPLVARVFLNRLRLGMRLQSDPTTIYAESGGAGDLGRGLTRDDLEQASPYNTYVVAGLPAGPICAPGIASLEAVAHPARSDALYFVADGTGGHVFADTLAEHGRNVARYRRLAH